MGCSFHTPSFFSFFSLTEHNLSLLSCPLFSIRTPVLKLVFSMFNTFYLLHTSPWSQPCFSLLKDLKKTKSWDPECDRAHVWCASTISSTQMGWDSLQRQKSLIFLSFFPHFHPHFPWVHRKTSSITAPSRTLFKKVDTVAQHGIQAAKAAWIQTVGADSYA